MVAYLGDYTTLALLKAQVRVTDNADDTAFSAAITAASRAIDHACGRQFGVSTAVARTYTRACGLWIDGQPAVAVDDISSTTSLVVKIDPSDLGTYPTTLTLNTDFTLWPYNADKDGKPWTHLLTRSTSAEHWPAYTNGVQVTALFGWAAVPAQVAQAALIQAARFFVRRDASFGIAGSPEMGNEMRLLDRLDPDVAVLLSGVKRWWGAA